MPSRVAVLPTSRPTPPMPPTKLFREPTLNHDSSLMATEEEYDKPSSKFAFFYP